ncbi:MAG TPA: 30S ribosomal protein S8e [archaeon]|nr:30S ribosomal protein S8e [archaeon]
MPQSHGNFRKRKSTGGKVRLYRGKRAFEMGSAPTETTLGEAIIKTELVRGGNRKTHLMRYNFANVTNPSTKETKKVEISKVIKNPANKDYTRRGIITKGTIIETPLGQAKVTSRPGQNGVINAVIVKESTSRT